MGNKHANITSLNETEARTVTKGSKFCFTAKRLGPQSGSKQLGCSWYSAEPGRQAFPHHFHCANEEAIFILSGRGEMRIGTEYIAVAKGDYIALPVGPDHAHSLANIGDVALEYLCFSTMVPTDVMGYPDSGKVAAVGAKDLARGMMSSPDVWVRLLVKDGHEIADYYAGEDSGPEL